MMSGALVQVFAMVILRPLQFYTYSKKIYVWYPTIIAFILFVLGLTACGSGDLERSAATTISGQVIKGPVSNALVTVFEVTTEGNAGDVLATTKTDETGQFRASVMQGFNGPVLIEATGGTFSSPVTGNTQALPDASGLGLQSVVEVMPGEESNTQVTPITTISVQAAQKMPGGLTAINVRAAGEKVGLSLGVGYPYQTKPINPSDLGSASGAAQEEINHGLANEGIQFLAEQWQLPYKDIYAEVARDMSDGVLDGKEGDMPVMGTQGFIDAVTSFSENPLLNRSGGFFVEPEAFLGLTPRQGGVLNEINLMTDGAEYCETLGGCPGTPHQTPKQEIFPLDNSDLITIQEKIRGLKTALTGCRGSNCGDMVPLAKQLLELETYLDAYLKAMNAASAAVALHHATLIGQNGITQVNLDNVRAAIIMHVYLHNLGSALLDLASLKDFSENISEFGEKADFDQITSAYEMMKDAEGVLTTAMQSLHIIEKEVQLASAIAPAWVDELILLGILKPGDTQQTLKDNLNDLISQSNDALSTIRELLKIYKETPGGVKELAQALLSSKDIIRGYGQMVGLLVKTVSKQVLDERKQIEAEKIKAMAAETGTNLNFYLSYVKIEDRRSETEHTLTDVRIARIAVWDAIVSLCGSGPIILRPDVQSFTIPDSGTGANRYEWGLALSHILSLIEISSSVLDTGMPIPGVATSCSQAEAIPESILPLVQRETTECPACQSIVDQINLLRAYREVLHIEKNRIQRNIDEAYSLELRRKALLDEASRLLEQNQTLFGLTGNKFDQRVQIAANQQGILQLTSMSAAIQEEIERLRAEEWRLFEIEEAFAVLQEEIVRLLDKLAYQESISPCDQPSTDG